MATARRERLRERPIQLLTLVGGVRGSSLKRTLTLLSLLRPTLRLASSHSTAMLPVDDRPTIPQDETGELTDGFELRTLPTSSHLYTNHRKVNTMMTPDEIRNTPECRREHANHGFMGEVMFQSRIWHEQQQREQKRANANRLAEMEKLRGRIQWITGMLPFVSIEFPAYCLEREALEKRLRELETQTTSER